MASEPANPKLWQMVITQARARFATYPSPGASHWVHDQYVKHGGKFIDTSEVTKRKKAMIAARRHQLENQRAHYNDDKKSSNGQSSVKKSDKTKGKK